MNLKMKSLLHAAVAGVVFALLLAAAKGSWIAAQARKQGVPTAVAVGIVAAIILIWLRPRSGMLRSILSHAVAIGAAAGWAAKAKTSLMAMDGVGVGAHAASPPEAPPEATPEWY